MTRIDDLLSARDVMWASMNEAPAAARAPLMNQWRALEATIATLSSDAEKAGDPVDEIAARRSARGGSTARSGRAEGRSS